MCHSGEYFQSFGCHSLDLPELTPSDEATAADKELLLKSLRERGYEVQQVRIGGKGVEVEIM